ncbi:MAG TPA: T9SS type A sorting domain-containing protein, partial [Bacteroidia bacterium]|nr:T9SS type A sorting domain-containing protein [Bacteroidia bacterium]
DRIKGTLEEIPNKMVCDAANNTYIIGRFSGMVDFDPDPVATHTLTASGSGHDIFILKLDINGHFVWVSRLGGSSDDDGIGISIDASGNLLVCGYFQGSMSVLIGGGKYTISSSGLEDAFFAKYNTSGSCLGIWRIGGSGTDEATSVKPGAGGNIIVGGEYGSLNCDFDPGTGTVHPASFGGMTDEFVASYSGTASFGWVKCGGDSDNDETSEVVTDLSGNIYACGVAGVGSIDLGGGSMTTAGAPGSGTSDIFLACYNSGGTHQWSELIGSDSDDVPANMVRDDLGYLYITGYFSHIIDFDPGPGILTKTSAGRLDIFIARFGTDGSLRNVDAFGDVHDDGGHGIAVSAELKDIYTTGDFDGTVNFDPFMMAPPLTSVGLTGFGDAFLTRHNWDSLPARLASPGIVSQAPAFSVSAYPNPCSGSLVIRNAAAGSVIELYSADGKKTGSWPVENEGTFSIGLNAYENGIYFLRIVRPGGAVQNEKIVLQH